MVNLESLITRLKKNGALRDVRIESAFRAVPRAHFVPRKLRGEAYEDYPLPIGLGATISQPTTVAFMLEKLDVWGGHRILDVGSGSGWTTALLSYLAGPHGKVIGLEIVPELVTFGQKNLMNFYSHILKNIRIEIGQAEILQATKEGVGLSGEAPFDRILVSAAAKEMPQELIGQLKVNGVMIIPIGAEGEIQKIVRLQKKYNEIPEIEEYPGFVFVPLK